MAKEVTCPPCGEVLRADSDEEIVATVKQHAHDEHGHELTAEQILETAREAA